MYDLKYITMKIFAKFSGIAYLLIFISGFYANFAILESLIDLNSSEQTTLNIINNSIQFRYTIQNDTWDSILFNQG